MTTQLVRYDEMCRAIDAAYIVDEVKDIRDKAVAFEAYFKQAKNPEPERRACEIRLRAERRAGQLLKAMEKAKGAAGPGRGKAGAHAASAFTDAPTLADLGLTRKQSSKWQQLADVPQEAFEAALSGPDKPSAGGILAKKKPKGRPMDPHALWLWGRLRDFERDGILNRSQVELLKEMTEGMRADVQRLAPIVANWLRRSSNGKEKR